MPHERSLVPRVVATHPHDPESIAVTSVSLAEDELEMSLTAPASASGARGHAGPVNGCVD